jgi:hypothetical protein
LRERSSRPKAWERSGEGTCAWGVGGMEVWLWLESSEPLGVNRNVHSGGTWKDTRVFLGDGGSESMIETKEAGDKGGMRSKSVWSKVEWSRNNQECIIKHRN